MANYADIKKQVKRQDRMKYANGGRINKKPSVVVNVISQPQGQGPGAGAMPPAGPMPGGPMAPPPMKPPMPVPPPAANMAAGAMGGPPGMFARGGRIKEVQGGASSGVGRLRHNKNPQESVSLQRDLPK